MALIAVLWLVAALSLMVSGVSGVVRQEARMVSVARQRLEAQALGDAAIMIALQKLSATPRAVTQLTDTSVAFNGVEVPVTVMPLSGLININGASLPLLAALLTIGGGLPEGQAQQLAINIVDLREKRSPTGRSPERFEAVEDLMQVPGFDFDLYARLAPFVTASNGGSGSAAVNPLAAPPEVLAILANGDQAMANRIAEQRASGQPGVDTTGLAAGLASGGNSSRRYRITAHVPLAAGGRFDVERSVYFGSRSRDGLPWYTFETRQTLQP
ncbi:MAG: general secretion pathway protein GspK [Comamonas sp.]